LLDCMLSFNLRPVLLLQMFKMNTPGLRSPKNATPAALCPFASGLCARCPLPRARGRLPVLAQTAQTPGTRRGSQRDRLQAVTKLILCMLLVRVILVLKVMCRMSLTLA
jgi:hypothetical protein